LRLKESRPDSTEKSFTLEVFNITVGALDTLEEEEIPAP
jgi:hypothetical protein